MHLANPSIGPGFLATLVRPRRGGRADECSGLENRRGCKPTVGSNPPPSAIRASIGRMCRLTTDERSASTRGPGSHPRSRAASNAAAAPGLAVSLFAEAGDDVMEPAAGLVGLVAEPADDDERRV